LAISVSIWPRKASRFRRVGRAGHDLGVERLGFGIGEVLGLRGGMAVVGRGGAHFLEKGAPRAVGVEVVAPRGAGLPAERAEGRDVVGEAREIGIDHRRRAGRR
jgi:hypothetical protein